MRMRYLIYVSGLLVVVGLAQCTGAGRPKSITIKGSDTMVLLGQRWAERYMEAHPGAIIQVTGGGSGTGIAALINGTTEICQSSRPINEAEQKQIQERFGSPAHETIVARDGLAIYVHESIAITELSVEQLRAIYSGTVKNWKDVGGPDEQITPYGRENSSGTYEYFKEHVLQKGDFAPAVQTLPGTAAVVNAVSQDPRGIGYGGAAYAKGVKQVAVRADAASPPVLPTKENVVTGAYPISRDLYFYLRKQPEGPTREFIDYVLSDAGQGVVADVGYFPIR